MSAEVQVLPEALQVLEVLEIPRLKEEKGYVVAKLIIRVVLSQIQKNGNQN